MGTVLSFKDTIDLPEWRPLSPAPNNATAGVSLACDLRNDASAEPNIYQLATAAILNKYNIKNDEWLALATPGLGGTFAAGAGSTFIPSWGPYGTVAAGCTATSIVLSTALPAAVGVNQLANRGDGVGYKIRIVGNAGAGSSGKTEEAFIVGNTAGTTPTLTLDRTLTFTPANGDAYELLSGAIMLFSAGALAATIIRKYCVATQYYSSVTNTNYIATIATDMTIFPMDEQYVPYTRKPGEGFLVDSATYDNGIKNCLTATASAAGTITGQAASGDATVAANEYTNFQIRIVEDTGTPAATGQRRKIVSHTGPGGSPVYTLLTNWTTTPSATAKYVIEYNNDVLSWNGATTVTYSYRAGFTADGAWSTAATAGNATQYANPSGAHAAGAMVIPSFGIVPDSAKNSRHSYFIYLRGGGTATADLFDIAGAGTTGLWTASIAYGNSGGVLPNAGAAAVYDGATNQGRYGYISSTGTQRFLRFDVKNRVLEPWAYMRYPQSTVTAGDKVALGLFVDGGTKLSFLYTITQALATFFHVANQR